MRLKFCALAVLMTILGQGYSAPAMAGSRIFRCVGPHGVTVFRDRPCSRAGLRDAGERKPALFKPPARRSEGATACLFESKPLALGDSYFEHTELRLVIDVDDEGPYFSIVVAGRYPRPLLLPDPATLPPATDALEEPIESESHALTAPVPGPPVTATFDARVSSQGLRMSDGSFHAAEWRMGEQILGFGRSRMRHLLTALSREQASLVVWFQGFSQPVQSASIPPEQFRLAVDNVRRCWKTRSVTR